MKWILLTDLSKSHPVTSLRIRKQQTLSKNSDPYLNKMYKRMTQEWESSKDDRASDSHQTKLRNRTSSDQMKPCKRSATEFEQKSRRGRLPGLLFCYRQFALLLLLLQAVTKVHSKFFLVFILLSRCVSLTLT